MVPSQRIWPRQLLVDRSVRDCELTRRIVSKWKHGPVEEIDDARPVIERIYNSRQPETEGKRHLYLTRYPGRFIKPCQGMIDSALCCNYHVIDLAQNCNLECAYCFLQSYLNNPLMVQYTNIEDLMAEIEQMTSSQPDAAFRIGTGELTDSLALDPLTGFSSFLAEQFSRYPNVALELKTKTSHIDNLLKIEPPKNTIISWSMNSPKMVRQVELKTASLGERIEAARRCQEHGYQLGFHFDPLIMHDGWKEGYRETVERMFDKIDPEGRIAWISLGALRFQREMKETLKRRFPGVDILTGEFVPGFDGKMRYFLPLRVELYSHMVELLRGVSPNLEIYLCMDSPEAWRRVFDQPPADNEGFDGRLARSCGCAIKNSGHCRA